MAPETIQTESGGHANANRAAPGRRQRGFSLPELMISIGILAIGLAMVAAVFPAAIALNRRSVKSVIGSIIAEDGLALAKAAMASGAIEIDNPNSSGVLQELADDSLGNQDPFTKEMCRFPQGDMSSPYGVVMMWRRILDDSGAKQGHQLVAVSYRRRLALDVSEVVITKTSPGYAESPYVFLNNCAGRIGSPLINRADGEYAMITAMRIGGTFVTGVRLDRWIRYEKSPSGGLQLFYVMENHAMGDQDPSLNEMRFSPAMAVLESRAALDWR